MMFPPDCPGSWLRLTDADQAPAIGTGILTRKEALFNRLEWVSAPLRFSTALIPEEPIAEGGRHPVSRWLTAPVRDLIRAGQVKCSPTEVRHRGVREEKPARPQH